MTLYKLLFASNRRFFFSFILLSILLGASNVGLLFMINQSIDYMINFDDDGYIIAHAPLYAVLLVTYIVLTRVQAVGLITYSQNVAYRIRKDIVEKFILLDYNQLHDRKDKIYANVTADVQKFSTSFDTLIYMMTSLATIIGALCYILTISSKLFLLLSAMLVFSIGIYRLFFNKIYSYFIFARNVEDRFFFQLNQIIGGLKELKINKEKEHDAYYNHLVPLLEETKVSLTKGHKGFVDLELVNKFLFYAVLGMLVYWASHYFVLDSSNIVSFVLVLLFLIGPINTVMDSIEGLAQAEVAAKKISALDKEMDLMDSDPYTDKDVQFPCINSIDVKHIERSIGEFSLGPINVSLSAGQLIFICGGNGSGKSSLVKLLTGIMYPESGHITINNHIQIGSENYSAYRNLFSAVFSDFFLFDKLYGIGDFDMDRARRYLALFELDEIVRIEPEGFSNSELSTGQKKRLALIAALLEDRPFLVLDEWAADQDPYFRKKFYLEILPLILSEGKTVIAVTHDDRYYHVADILLKMDQGMLRVSSTNEKDLIGA